MVSSSTLPWLTYRLNQLRYYKRRWLYHAYDTWRLLSQRQQLAQTINQHEIRVMGLRRTGNHAIIAWIKQQTSGQVMFLNNVEPCHSPYRFYHLHFPDRGYGAAAWGRFTPQDWLIYSYEDHDLAQIGDPRYYRCHDLYVGKSAKIFDVLILRDPFNLLASRYKKQYLSVKGAGSVVDLWLQYAREFVGETQYLKNPKVLINYNRWVVDRDYRQAIAQQLGLTFSDAGIDYVGSYGGGSSFDGMALRGQAAQMEVNQRWRHFETDAGYRTLLQNQALFDYSKRIFGVIAGTESLRLER